MTFLPPGRCFLVLVAIVLAPALAFGAGVSASFDVTSPAAGPFPSDLFTVPDATQNTGVRVSLPKPSPCGALTVCADIDVLNTQDGFNLQPRLSIPFTGDIDPASVSGATVFLVSLGDTLGGGGAGAVVGINQVVWDVATKTLHVESDELLAQHTRYALIVTRGVLDSAGDPVDAGAFATFHHDLNFGQTKDRAVAAYREALKEGVRASGVHQHDIAVASVFTTQSATAQMEKIRDQVKADTPAPATFMLGNGGAVRAVFPATSITSILFTRQIGTPAVMTTSPLLGAGPLPIAALNIVPGSVSTVAFGRYSSPDYETPDRFIPAVGTRTGAVAPQGLNDIDFNLFLPGGPKPAAGYPVAIFGHGFGDNKNSSPLVVAMTLARHGIATIAINVVGHGGGALGTLTVTTTAAPPVVVPAGGRGINQDAARGSTTIDSTEGVNAAPPRTLIGSRDGLRQTVIDLMQLVRVLEVGMDVDGDGFADLDGGRVYYFGQSFGGIYGTKLVALDGSVRAGVLNVPGGPIIDVARLGSFRPLTAASLNARTPGLLNGGVSGFTENLPLRDLPPLSNTVAGAMAIQEVIEHSEWATQSGNPVAYARLISSPVIFQFANGDVTVPNPTTSNILRAGSLEGDATYFRNDLAFAMNPATPKNPHTFLTRITTPSVLAFAFGAQEQIATFFDTDGALVIDPDGAGLFFEVPIVLPLPEDLDFIP